MPEALYHLIQSLDKTEKSYFKRYAYKSIRSKSETYYKLFDILDKQKAYNKKLIFKKIKVIKTAKQLTDAKYYLYNLILNSLCNCHEKKMIRAQLHRQLEQVEILYHKSLHNQAKKIILRAKKTAQEYELLPYLMQLHYWDAKIS